MLADAGVFFAKPQDKINEVAEGRGFTAGAELDEDVFQLLHAGSSDFAQDQSLLGEVVEECGAGDAGCGRHAVHRDGLIAGFCEEFEGGTDDLCAGLPSTPLREPGWTGIHKMDYSPIFFKREERDVKYFCRTLLWSNHPNRGRLILSEYTLNFSKWSAQSRMSRPKSPTKRAAILEATLEVVAERGYAHAPTSAISKAAGVAEGTLFTYFDGKDALINELYRVLRKEFDRELADYPFLGDARERLRFIWDRLLSLAAQKPKRLLAIKQLRASGRLYKDAEEPTVALTELLRSTKEAARGERLEAVPAELLVILFRAQAEATVDYIAAHPAEEAKAREAGFFLFWRGLTGQ